MKQKHNNFGLKRAVSRLMAIQIFYQYNFLERKKPLSDITIDVIENYALSADEEISSYEKKIDRNFVENLVMGLDQHEQEILQDINQHVRIKSSVEDVAREILLCAAFELRFLADIPYKVVINEYVDIAAGFFPESKVTFINGVLENLAKHYRAEQFKNSE
jgi:N utilization substance protein B